MRLAVGEDVDLLRCQLLILRRSFSPVGLALPLITILLWLNCSMSISLICFRSSMNGLNLWRSSRTLTNTFTRIFFCCSLVPARIVILLYLMPVSKVWFQRRAFLCLLFESAKPSKTPFLHRLCMACTHHQRFYGATTILRMARSYHKFPLNFRENLEF